MGWSKPKVDKPRDATPAALVGYGWHIDRKPGRWNQTQVDYLALGDRVVNGWRESR